MIRLPIKISFIIMALLILLFYSCLLASEPEAGRHKGVEHPEMSKGHGETGGHDNNNIIIEEGYEVDRDHGKDLVHEKERHGEEDEVEPHEEDQHTDKTPDLYYIHWGLLGLTLIIVLAYCLRVMRQGRPSHEGLRLAGFLVVLAIGIYLSDQLPTLQEYHEPASLGMIRFLYKVTLGILFVFYAFIGMHEHD